MRKFILKENFSEQDLEIIHDCLSEFKTVLSFSSRDIRVKEYIKSIEKVLDKFEVQN